MKISRTYYVNNFRLALPIMLAMAGQSIVQIIDNIMVGRLGAAELAAASLAGMITFNIVVVGMGISVGLTPLVGRNYAVGRYAEASKLFQNSIVLSTVVALILSMVSILFYFVLPYMGQPASTLELGRGYYLWLTASFVPFVLFLSVKQFMEGVGNTKVAMFITIFCNVVNIVLNYVFIYGKLGAPALGVTGAGIATFIARLLMPLIFGVYMVTNVRYSHYITMFRRRFNSLKVQWQLLKVGTPIAVQMILEFLSFTSITVMMGWIGVTAQAATQILTSMISFAFLLTTGFAGAATINVSHEYGRGNGDGVRNYGYSAMYMSLAVMSVAVLSFMFFGREIATIFTSDAEVISLAAGLFVLAAIFEIIDGLQATALGALRGMADVFVTMKYAFISYIVTSIPCSYLLGFVFDLEAYGVIGGLFCGLSVAALLYIRRFNFYLRSINIGSF